MRERSRKIVGAKRGEGGKVTEFDDVEVGAVGVDDVGCCVGCGAIVGEVGGDVGVVC